MTQHTHIAQQGHRYRYCGKDVLALQSGHAVQVIEIDPSNPCEMGQKHTVKASWLIAQPMRYYNGEVPA